MKRVISLVPSLTETLLAAKINVVGRTRYCIHPQNEVAGIPIVGGTKDVRWSLVKPLNADLLLLDQEENPKRFADQAPLPFFATHITSIEHVGLELLRLAQYLGSEELQRISQRWEVVIQKKRPLKPTLSIDFCHQMPGVIEWWVAPDQPVKQVLYLIWRNPWMMVTKATFIGSVLEFLGIDLPTGPMNYPQIDLKDYAKPGTLLLFSSEPYDFRAEREELMKLNVASALVDGESFSWFGIRALKFLETATL